MEQEAMRKERQNILYPHAPNGRAKQTNSAGTGLLPPRIGSAQLSRNFVDIESRLYGISSNNLVKPQETMTPELYDIPLLHIHERVPLMKPPPFEPMTGQRLRLFHS